MYDLLSIMVSRIQVGCIAKSESVRVPRSNVIIATLSKMLELGYIHYFKLLNHRDILVGLKYFEHKPVIRRLVRISKPGKRIYYKIRNFSEMSGRNVQGFYLISTSRGLLTDQECLYYRVGGEPLLLVF